MEALIRANQIERIKLCHNEGFTDLYRNVIHTKTSKYRSSNDFNKSYSNSMESLRASLIDYLNKYASIGILKAPFIETETVEEIIETICTTIKKYVDKPMSREEIDASIAQIQNEIFAVGRSFMKKRKLDKLFMRMGFTDPQESKLFEVVKPMLQKELNSLIEQSVIDIESNLQSMINFSDIFYISRLISTIANPESGAHAMFVLQWKSDAAERQMYDQVKQAVVTSMISVHSMVEITERILHQTFPQLAFPQLPPTVTVSTPQKVPPMKRSVLHTNHPLIQAAKMGDFEKLNDILTENIANINDKDSNGMTALMAAARKNHIKCVMLLINAGANVNDANSRGFTALMLSCKHGNEQCARALITAGAAVDATNNDGYTSLILACFSNREQCALELLKAGADVNKEGPQGYSNLMAACQNGYDRVARALIENGANVNYTKADGWTAMMSCCQDGHEQCALALIKAGANLDATEQQEGWTALMLSCKRRHEKCTRILILARAVLDTVCNKSRTALMYATKSNCKQCVTDLILAGANPNKQAHNKETALSIALENGFKDCVQLLEQYTEIFLSRQGQAELDKPSSGDTQAVEPKPTAPTKSSSALKVFPEAGTDTDEKDKENVNRTVYSREFKKQVARKLDEMTVQILKTTGSLHYIPETRRNIWKFDIEQKLIADWKRNGKEKEIYDVIEILGGSGRRLGSQ